MFKITFFITCLFTTCAYLASCRQPFVCRHRQLYYQPAMSKNFQHTYVLRYVPTYLASSLLPRGAKQPQCDRVPSYTYYYCPHSSSISSIVATPQPPALCMADVYSAAALLHTILLLLPPPTHFLGH